MSSLEDLIKKLQILTEFKYPDRKWSEEFRVNVTFEWVGKEDQLQDRIEKLKKELNIKLDE